MFCWDPYYTCNHNRPFIPFITIHNRLPPFVFLKRRDCGKSARRCHGLIIDRYSNSGLGIKVECLKLNLWMRRPTNEWILTTGCSYHNELICKTNVDFWLGFTYDSPSRLKHAMQAMKLTGMFAHLQPEKGFIKIVWKKIPCFQLSDNSSPQLGPENHK